MRWFDQNSAAFGRIVATRKVLFALQLPQKEEVAVGRRSEESALVTPVVKRSGVKYIDGMHECGLTRSDFHEADAHPNEAGYRKIMLCVARALKTVA